MSPSELPHSDHILHAQFDGTRIILFEQAVAFLVFPERCERLGGTRAHDAVFRDMVDAKSADHFNVSASEVRDQIAVDRHPHWELMIGIGSNLRASAFDRLSAVQPLSLASKRLFAIGNRHFPDASCRFPDTT